MKTKARKQEELNEGKGYLDQSQWVLLFDFSSVGTADMRKLRTELKKSGNPLMVIKKRLLGILLKERGVETQAGWKTQVATVFASDLEKATAAIWNFFKQLEKEKKVEKAAVKILGGYDVKNNVFLAKEQVVSIGQLPPREVLLAQLLYMLCAPVRSLLYVLDQKSKQTTEASA